MVDLGFFVQIALRQKPKGVPRMQRMFSLCLVIHRCMRGTPLGFCLMVIVNEKPLSVVLLIYVAGHQELQI